MKKIFLHGIVAGILSAFASTVYFNMYQSALGTSFDKIINGGSIVGSSILGCVLIATGYFLLFKFKKVTLTGILNILIVLCSFVSIIGPISMSLPLDIETPELFPGLVIPMHFFPALIFFAIAPFFEQQPKIEKPNSH
jgi:hypothetical protein